MLALLAALSFAGEPVPTEPVTPAPAADPAPASDPAAAPADPAATAAPVDAAAPAPEAAMTADASVMTPPPEPPAPVTSDPELLEVFSARMADFNRVCADEVTPNGEKVDGVLHHVVSSGKVTSATVQDAPAGADQLGSCMTEAASKWHTKKTVNEEGVLKVTMSRSVTPG
jgi:hypothetical protein